MVSTQCVPEAEGGTFEENSLVDIEFTYSMKVYSSGFFSFSHKVVQPSPRSILGYFCHPQKETLHPSTVILLPRLAPSWFPPRSLPAAPSNHSSSFSMHLPSPDSLYEQHRTPCALWCLASFMEHGVFKLHPCYNPCQPLWVFKAT